MVQDKKKKKEDGWWEEKSCRWVWGLVPMVICSLKVLLWWLSDEWVLGLKMEEGDGTDWKKDMEKMVLGSVVCFRPEVNGTMAFYEFCLWGCCDGVGFEEKRGQEVIVRSCLWRWVLCLVQSGLSRTVGGQPQGYFFSRLTQTMAEGKEGLFNREASLIPWHWREGPRAFLVFLKNKQIKKVIGKLLFCRIFWCEM